MGDTPLSTNSQSPQVQDLCPHCGGTLNLTALSRVIVDSAAIDNPSAVPIVSRLQIQLSNRRILVQRQGDWGTRDGADRCVGLPQKLPAFVTNRSE
jgi:hypothetical protein